MPTRSANTAYLGHQHFGVAAFAAKTTQIPVDEVVEPLPVKERRGFLRCRSDRNGSTLGDWCFKTGRQFFDGDLVPLQCPIRVPVRAPIGGFDPVVVPTAIGNVGDVAHGQQREIRPALVPHRGSHCPVLGKGKRSGGGGRGPDHKTRLAVRIRDGSVASARQMIDPQHVVVRGWAEENGRPKQDGIVLQPGRSPRQSVGLHQSPVVQIIGGMYSYRLSVPRGFEPTVMAETVAEGPPHDDLAAVKPTVFGLKVFDKAIETTQEKGPEGGTVGAVQVAVGVGHGIAVKGLVGRPLNDGPIVVVLGVGGVERRVVEVDWSGVGDGEEMGSEENSWQHCLWVYWVCL